MYCPSCGEPANDSAVSCSSCQSALVPLSQYRTILKCDIFTQGLRVAGLGDRLLAQLLDGVLVMVLFFVIGMAIAVQSGALTADGFSLSGKPALLAMGLLVIMTFLYFMLSEGLTGRTIGKALVGIEVRRTDGSHNALKASVIRNILRLVDIIALYLVGFLVAVLSKYRQRLGDHAAGTIVVDNRLRRPFEIGVLILWLALMGGGIWGSVALYHNAPGPAQNAAAKDFSISQLKFLESKGGPLRKPGPYKPGDTVFAEYQVTGFTLGPDRRIEVALGLEVLDPNGLALMKPWHDKMSGSLAQGSRELRGYYNLTLPEFASPGSYQVLIHAIDALNNNKEVKRVEKFEVQATAGEPAGALEIRGFVSGISKDMLSPAKPVLQPPATLHMSFKLFGLSFKDDRLDAKVSLKLRGPDGTLVKEWPEWAVIQDEFFYHPPTFYLPVTGYFEVPEDGVQGVYTQHYEITDNVSGKSLEYTAEFEVQ